VHVVDPCRGYKQYKILRKKQTVDPEASNSDTIVDSAVSAYSTHVGYEEEWVQHTPLSESNTHDERL